MIHGDTVINDKWIHNGHPIKGIYHAGRDNGCEYMLLINFHVL
jgi:hypothetical protein